MDIVGRYDAWVFDMDGTLTEPQHDFSEIRRRLGFAPGTPILEGIEQETPAEQERLIQIVSDWEWEVAKRARIAPGARELLSVLADRGVPFGVLTRNRRDIALFTLECVELLEFFKPEEILGRDEAEPKPAPDGVEHLLRRWPGVKRPVMVGDYIHDMKAGRRAGCETILVGDACPPEWRSSVDWWGATLAEVESLMPINSD